MRRKGNHFDYNQQTFSDFFQLMEKNRATQSDYPKFWWYDCG